MRDLFREISSLFSRIEVADGGFEHVMGYLRMARETGAKLIFIGNGGSAAIASHMAADWMKNGNFCTLCFNDGAALTCLANDTGYENVFKIPLAYHAKFGDILFAISSSGESKSILSAVELAKRTNLNIVTLSGFGKDNSLRKMGGVNFYVPSRSYGAVEITHLAILHSMLDEITNGH